MSGAVADVQPLAAAVDNARARVADIVGAGAGELAYAQDCRGVG